MMWREVVARVVRQIEGELSIEGAFLGGSLVTENWDEFSDIDLGIATRNTPRDLQTAFALRHEIATSVGRPIHSLEKEWGHSKMVALLYGKVEFPPIGFELDVFFSQLRYVCELMPGASFGVVFDRHGKLKPELDKLGQALQLSEIECELRQQAMTFPFDTNHAVKAHARGDLFNFQFVAERMRGAIFSAAAARQGALIRGSKRTFRYLTPAETQVIQRSYHEFSWQTIHELAELYLLLLAQVQQEYGIEAEVEHLRAALPEIS